MEFDRAPSAIHEELCQWAFDQVDGFLAVPHEPGLGIEVNDRALVRLTIHRQWYA